MRQLKGLIRMVKGGEAERLWLQSRTEGKREAEKYRGVRWRRGEGGGEGYGGWEKEGSGRSEGMHEVEPR